MIREYAEFLRTKGLQIADLDGFFNDMRNAIARTASKIPIPSKESVKPWQIRADEVF